jgi:hypothetical protein
MLENKGAKVAKFANEKHFINPSCAQHEFVSRKAAKAQRPLRACSGIWFGAKASKFCFNGGKICRRSGVTTAKILTNSETKFAG